MLVTPVAFARGKFDGSMLKRKLKMKRRLLSLFVCTSVMTTFGVALADSKNFTGPAIYGELNHSATTVELKSDDVTLSGVGKQSISGALGASYGFALSSTSVLLLGGTYDLSNAKFLEISGGGDSVTGKIKQRWSLFVAPGFVVSPQTLLYGKLSYASGKATLGASGAGIDLESSSERFRGVGYGAGIRTQINRNLFAGVEVTRVNYNDKGFDGVDVGTGTTTGSVQLGYRF